MQVVVENCSSIKIGDLQKKIRKIIDRDYPDSTIQETYDYTEKELHKFEVNGQKFEYTSIETKLGGHRWFFICPECKKRVNKLFLPPEGSGLTHKYFCKACHGLKNRSMVMSRDKMYKKVFKPLKRMRKIEERLEKGYLQEDKITELLDEYEELKNRLRSTPEYRLHQFRKTKGQFS